MNRTILCTVLALGLIATQPTEVTAGAGGWGALKAQGAQAVLAAADKTHNSFKTQVWVFRMTLKPAGGAASRTMKFKIWQKGSRRLVRFLEPGDLKGMSVLMRSPTVMYVYSPQTDNVRRVASHARRQSFLGSDVSLSDMSTVDLSAQYNATFGRESGDSQWLTLRAKPGAKVDWSMLKVRVHKKTRSFSRIEYFHNGRRRKVQDRSRLKIMSGIPTYRRSVFIDMKSKHRTILDMLSQKTNTPLPSSLFKKRNLIRGG